MDMRIENLNVYIDGNLKSLSEVRQVSSEIDLITKESKNIVLILSNSLSIPSSLIGYLIKIIKQNSVNLTLKVGDKRAYDTLDDLNLVRLFNVQMIK